MIHPSKLIGNKISTLSIWVSSDNHDGEVVNETALAVSHVDNEEWDLGLNLGDVIAPDDEGDGVYTHYLNQYSGFTNHSLDKIYHLQGNHDSPKDSANIYWEKYCSPFDSDNSYYANKPFPVTGSEDAYYITIGNLLIICVGDWNNGTQPGGEAGLGSGSLNWRASGNITTAQWNFLKNTVQNNTDKIIIVCTHHGIKGTNIGMEWKEFNQAFSRNASYDPTGIYNVDDSHRMGYIAYINNDEGTVNTTTGDSDATNEIKTWLESYGQYIDIWLNGHYHRKIGDTWNSKTRYAEKYGTRFLNCSVMNSKLHTYYWNNLEVKSNFLNINGDKMTIKTYVHKDPSSSVSVGYYAPEEFEITLKRKFVR